MSICFLVSCLELATCTFDGFVGLDEGKDPGFSLISQERTFFFNIIVHFCHFLTVGSL